MGEQVASALVTIPPEKLKGPANVVDVTTEELIEVVKSQGAVPVTKGDAGALDALRRAIAKVKQI
jgi:hypothetical protein